METSETLVAMTGMLASFGLPLLVIAIILVYKHHRNRLHQETILRLAEKGLPVPPELLQPPARSPSPLIVHSTWRAPPIITPASELATAMPRSL